MQTRSEKQSSFFLIAFIISIVYLIVILLLDKILL